MRSLSAWFIFLFALFGLVACQSGDSSTTESTDPTATNTQPADPAKPVKIGFIVKSRADSWFATELRFAQEAAKEKGFELIEMEGKDGQTVMNQMDQLKTQGAQGVIICAPDVKLGPAIVAAAERNGLKLMTVDDRLVGEDGKALANVPHLGISAYEIGKLVGTALVDEMKARGWDMKQTGACVLTIDSLETARERIRGAEEVITAAGFPKENIFRAAWSKHDAVGATDTAMPVLSQHQNIKNWIGFTSNDDGVMGIVRASEAKNISSANVIGVGINGNTVDTEFSKASGFYASVLLSAREHGYKTAEMMYTWIKDGTAPAMETYTTGTLINRDNWKDAWTKEGLN